MYLRSRIYAISQDPLTSLSSLMAETHSARLPRGGGDELPAGGGSQEDEVEGWSVVSVQVNKKMC